MGETKHLPGAATVCLNGQFVAATEARLPVGDRGLLYGLGFFETFRTSGGRPHRWSHHLGRLEAACARAGIALDSMLARDRERLGHAVRELLRIHDLPDAVFRYTVTAGAAAPPGPALQAGGEHLGPAEWLSLRPLPAPAPAGGVSLRVLNLPRDNGEWLPRPKSLNCANAFLGAEELRARSTVASDEGLFLSRDASLVVETARQNIVWIVGHVLRYPDPALGAVPGTCLAWLLEPGRPARPARASLGELLSADAIAVCNAVRGITPVREVWDAQDRIRLGTFASATHPLLTEFSERWRASLQATAGAAP